MVTKRQPKKKTKKFATMKTIGSSIVVAECMMTGMMILMMMAQGGTSTKVHPPTLIITTNLTWISNLMNFGSVCKGKLSAFKTHNHYPLWADIY